MLIELDRADFAAVAHLRHEDGLEFPLIRAVIDRTQPGTILVDRRERPDAAMVCTAFGFCCLLGRSDDAAFHAALAARLQAPGATDTSRLLWYAPPAWLQRKLDGMPADIATRRTRLRYEWDGASRAPAPWLPAGIAMRPLDRDLLAMSAPFGLDIGSRFWPDADAFLASGFGVGLTAGDELVALCYAAAIAQGRAEVDIATLPGHRNRGLGALAAHGFVGQCLQRGLTPAWDCFDYNAGSLRIAEQVGFARPRRYPFYTFPLPLPTDIPHE